jgi:ubiquinone/menaquinone biosynthesis C-methylase UbiE
MKYFIDNKFFALEKKILSKVKTIKNNTLILNFLINRLIYLVLKIEKILFDKRLNKDPNIIIKKDLDDLYNFICDINNFSDFSDKQIVKSKKFVMEKEHQNLFQKLWVNYNLQEFKDERLGRYIKRIKINKISNLIKDKKIVDFGCGHGNFLMSAMLFNAEKCVGIDYGSNSIKYAQKIKNKLFPKSNISFLNRSVYNSKLKSEYFDFAIQNGVFHHLNNEAKAYKEVHRVLKTGGYFWVYTDGGGGLRDFTHDLFQKIMLKFDNSFVQKNIRSIGLSTNKEYHLGDHTSAKYRHTDLAKIKSELKKIGFKYVRQLEGGFNTDFDYPFVKDKYFKEKFGSGDLRLLFKK